MIGSRLLIFTFPGDVDIGILNFYSDFRKIILLKFPFWPFDYDSGGFNCDLYTLWYLDRPYSDS